MRKFIVLLSIVTFGFAGWTVWNDPELGPKIKKMLPESFDTASLGASIRDAASGFAPSLTGGGSSGGGGVGGGHGQTPNYGGIGAANIVAGAIKGN